MGKKKILPRVPGIDLSLKASSSPVVSKADTAIFQYLPVRYLCFLLRNTYSDVCANSQQILGQEFTQARFAAFG